MIILGGDSLPVTEPCFFLLLFCFNEIRITAVAVTAAAVKSCVCVNLFGVWKLTEVIY